MRGGLAVGILLGALLALPSGSEGQTLAEIAAKEKERRKSQKPAKVYTEADLGAAKRGTFSVSGAEPEPAAEAAKPATDGTPKEKTEEDKRAEQEKAWRDQLKAANDEVTRLQGEVDGLQLKLNDNTGNMYSSLRTTLMQKFETAQQQLAAARQRVADLEEQGRRSRFR